MDALMSAGGMDAGADDVHGRTNAAGAWMRTTAGMQGVERSRMPEPRLVSSFFRSKIIIND